MSHDIETTKQSLKDMGIKYCLGAYVDIHGIPKGKFVPIDHLDHMVKGSELYTGYALDGLGQKPNEDEIASVPDLNSLIQLPWQPEVAWMAADNTLHGEPYEINTRVALKKVLAEAEAMGFGFNLGIECELFVLKEEEDGSLSVPDKDDKLT
ncbi:MAG: type III glutamate--ammonia ligase, partial [Piscirickettsiaceae bacterium CG_4_10_14_3_um_filter_44_349]